MADSSPVLSNPIPASVETTISNNTRQPVPMSRQQPPVPTEIKHYPVLATGWELIDEFRDNPDDALSVLKVAIGGKPYEWRFSKLTGDGELRALY
jgi:hypothetical protein